MTIQLTNRRRVEADELDTILGLDCPPVYVHGDGTVSDTRGISTPDVHESEVPTPWTMLTGRTNQYGYNGPHMHESEFIGRGMARDILATPGIWACTIAYTDSCNPDDGDVCMGCESGSGCEDNMVGWVTLHDDATPVTVPPSMEYDLLPGDYVDCLELGLSPTEGPHADINVNDDGGVFLTLTDALAFHTERWTDATGPFDSDGWLTPDGVKFVASRLRNVCPGIVWEDVDGAAWDDPSWSVEVELLPPVSRENVGELAHQAWAALTNVTDPGTFGREYLFDGAAWDTWTANNAVAT